MNSYGRIAASVARMSASACLRSERRLLKPESWSPAVSSANATDMAIPAASGASCSTGETSPSVLDLARATPPAKQSTRRNGDRHAL
jgi:hypothetical protein